MNIQEINPKHSQRANFYSFDIEDEHGVIRSVDKIFRIKDFLPEINNEGQVVIAILAYSGYFNGFFYNTKTHERIESDIFTYFGTMTRNIDLSNIKTGEDFLNLIFGTENIDKLETFLLIDSKHLSQIFKYIRSSFNQDGTNVDIFKYINQNLLAKNNNSWQSVFDFWKEYIDIKKQFFNFCEFQCGKAFAITNNNVLLADFFQKQAKTFHTPLTFITSKIYTKRVQSINSALRNSNLVALGYLKDKVNSWLSKLELNIEGQANIDTVLKAEVRSGVSFLLFHGVSGKYWSGKNLKRGVWLKPSPYKTSGLRVNESRVSLNLIQQKATIFSNSLVYYSTGYGNILSSCPVRSYSSLLGTVEQ